MDKESFSSESVDLRRENFKKLLEDEKNMIDKWLEELDFSSDKPVFVLDEEHEDKSYEAELIKDVLSDAMSYSYLSGGKKLRAILLYECYMMFAKRPHEELVKKFASAIELIQTYSLVHDDLPEMDNDEYRRGKKSTHVEFGQAMAVLTGDALLTEAFTLMSDIDSEDVNEYKGMLNAINYVAKSIGAKGMVLGQAIDILLSKEEEGKRHTEVLRSNEMFELSLREELWEDLVVGKTCKLIEASLVAGAMLAGVNNEVIELVEEIGFYLGLAFQIRDDILDEISTFEEMGKETGKDEDANKVTLISMYGIDRAEEVLSECVDKAKALIQMLPARREESLLFLFDVADYFATRGK
ncbi:MAG: polyprenyl synthetase family protein [Lachnospiraceae bacterium]|nr:polyprenyl synthetase family protein [Lachnospiraceae bacterium]